MLSTSSVLASGQYWNGCTLPCRTAASVHALGALSRKKATGTCFCHTRRRREVEGTQNERERNEKHHGHRCMRFEIRWAALSTPSRIQCAGARDVTAKRVTERACWPDPPTPTPARSERPASQRKKNQQGLHLDRLVFVHTGQQRAGSGMKDHTARPRTAMCVTMANQRRARVGE